MIFTEDTKKEGFNTALIKANNIVEITTKDTAKLEAQSAFVKKANDANVKAYSEFLVRMQLLEILGQLSEDLNV